jgi:hypothetical protein
MSTEAAEIVASWAGVGGKREIITTLVFLGDWPNTSREIQSRNMTIAEQQKFNREKVLAAMATADTIIQMCKDNPPK